MQLDVVKRNHIFQFKNGVIGLVQVHAHNRNFLLPLHLKQNYICSSRALYLWLDLAFCKSTPKTAARTSSLSRTCSSTFSSSSQGVNFLRRGVRSYTQCSCNVLAKFWRLVGCSKSLHWKLKLTAGTIAFRICMTCYRWKSTVLPGKLFFPKKRRKTAFFGGKESGVSWLWEELYAKLLGLGQLLGYPWKVWGITVQTSYWEGLWHQNCGYTSQILFFGIRTRKSVKNGTFSWLAPCQKIFNGKLFRGMHPENPWALRIPKK